MIKRLKNLIILRILKSYQILKKTNKKLDVYKIIDEMMNQKKFSDEKSFLDIYFFKDLLKDSNQIINQYFFYTFIYENKIFNRFLLFFFYKQKGSFFILPSFALKIIKKRIDISIIISLVLFKFYQIFKISKGFYFFFKVLINSFFGKRKKNISTSVFFINVIEKLLPSKTNGYDMVSSIIRNDEKKFSNYDIYSDFENKNELSLVKNLNLFILHDLKSLSKFLMNFFILFVISIFSLFSKKWYISLLFEESLKKLLIEYKTENYLSKKIYFNQTSFIYRPMWTYVNVTKKFDIAMIMFGSNIYKNEINEKFYKLMNWPEYFVWSENFQNKLIETLDYKFRSTICDYIGFNDTNKILKDEIDVIIFDDEPFREWYGTSLTRYEDHLTEKISLDFLYDINDVFCDKNFKIAIKLKKFNTKKTIKKYLRVFKNSNLKFLFIEPDFSAIEIVKKSKLVISFPFSSTAILAKKQNKKSIYYYPSKIKNEPWINEEIKIIEGKNKLLDWINKTII